MPLDDVTDPERPIVATRPFHVVGIGASAGGLDALERFFENLPGDCGMAFVLVQHLSPTFRSLMDEILARRTPLPIRNVESGMPVEPNHVYLMPPKKEMIISEGRLLLSDREHDHDLSLPIDVFFRSLARDCGGLAIAVVLSGSGSDGSRGVCAVHDAGGLVLVQDPETAQFDGMPRTSRDTGVADAVMAPEKMPGAMMEHVSGGGTRGPARATDGDRGMRLVYRMLEGRFGIDFTHYKPTTVTRRIERRIQLARIDDLGAYVERLQSEREELDALYRDLLIGVTRFFRNEEAFRTLSDRVLPELFLASHDAPLRVWVAGCATGEEVYTLAILLSELAPRFGGRPVKIFATDVHQGSLDVATHGLYPEEALSKVSPERLERYFVRRGTTYQVAPDLRQMVVFAPHNVVKDAPFTRVDLVSCRNLLIYLQPAAQQKALGHFHFALKRGGIMFLGPSESPGQLAHDFDAIDKRWRIYRKYTDTRTHVEARFSGAAARGSAVTREHPPGRATSSTVSRPSAAQLLAAYDALLDEFMPPGILVNEQRELVHVFGGAGEYLKLHDGRPGLDVTEMVDGELKAALLSGLGRAAREQHALVFKGVSVPRAGGSAFCDVTIRRLALRSGRATLLLISFEDRDAAPSRGRPTVEAQSDLGHVSREQLSVLETALTQARETLQTTTEELETSNEELQAANEELVASNEELQSTNEELQSVNEELYTVNAEYQRKIADLTELTNDMENLLSSTDIGTIFLDRELKIRKFTESIAETYNLLPQDIGRSIETFTHTLDADHLLDDLRTVLRTGEPVERELRGTRQRTYFLRLLPYRAAGAIDGVVLTLIDLSSLKAMEDALFHERHLLNSLLASVPDAIYFKDMRGRFIRTNDAMALRLGLGEPRDATGRSAFDLSHQNAVIDHQKDDEVLRTGEAQHYELERRLPGNTEEWDLVTRLPLKNAGGSVVGVIGILRDVTEQKRAEDEIQRAVRRRDEFLAMLSHELRNPLGAVVAAVSLLRKDRPEKRAMLLQVVERQSKHMARLLDDLLEASRVTQDKIELRKRVVDLRQVLEDAAESLRSVMESKNHELVMELDPGPLMVKGDDARLLQIQVNLLSNAAKYTPPGGRIHFEGKRDGEHATVRVRDNGVGIPKEMLGSIFELFVQSQRTLDRSDGGLGVGLTLVRALVRMHDGTITARSDGDGKGSEFVVRLPLFAGEETGPDPEHAAPKRAGLKKGAKVLVVEDNPDARQILCEILDLAGFECHPASDGEAALAAAESVRPDAAVIDIGLPSIDGFELARRLRKHPSCSPPYLIALTGYGRRVDREQALRAGFDEHLVKPVDTRTLLSLLGGSPSVLA